MSTRLHVITKYWDMNIGACAWCVFIWDRWPHFLVHDITTFTVRAKRRVTSISAQACQEMVSVAINKINNFLVQLKCTVCSIYPAHQEMHVWKHLEFWIRHMQDFRHGACEPKVAFLLKTELIKSTRSIHFSQCNQ